MLVRTPTVPSERDPCGVIGDSVTDSSHNVFQSEPDRLAKLMGLASGANDPWRPEELSVMLEQQLTAPIEFDFAHPQRDPESEGPGPAEPSGARRQRFRDLLFHPAPPVELLKLTKDFAKAHLQHPDSPVPRGIAKVLYCASIVAARLRCGDRISQLDDAALLRDVEWVLSQPWVDTQTRALFTEAREMLRK